MQQPDEKPLLHSYSILLISLLLDWCGEGMLLQTSQAVRTSIFGRPGACYLDVPGYLITATFERDSFRCAVNGIDALCYWLLCLARAYRHTHTQTQMFYNTYRPCRCTLRTPTEILRHHNTHTHSCIHTHLHNTDSTHAVTLNIPFSKASLPSAPPLHSP